MSVRASLRRLPELERYICPFLAPRVFTEWPTRLDRRTQLSTAPGKDSAQIQASQATTRNNIREQQQRTSETSQQPGISAVLDEPPSFQGGRDRFSRRSYASSEGPVAAFIRSSTRRNRRRRRSLAQPVIDAREGEYRRRRSRALYRVKSARVKKLTEGKYLDRMSESAGNIPHEALAESSWDYSFQALEQTLIRQKHREWPNLRVRVDPAVVDWIKEWVHEDSDMAQGWLQVPDADRAVHWQQIMLFLLRYKVNFALRFIRATHRSDWFPPAARVSDSFSYIATRYIDGVRTPDKRAVHALFTTILFVLDARPRRPVHLTQRTIFLLIPQIGVLRAIRLYTSFFAHGVWLHPYTLMHSMRVFSQTDQFDWVLRLFDHMDQTRRIDLSRAGYMAFWSTLLIACKKAPDLETAISAILRRMRSYGVEPTAFHYNIILTNAVDRTDSALAWRIFEHMGSVGQKPDQYTYSILFYDAKQRDDIVTMGRIIEHARANGYLQRNEYLVTDYLHAISTFDSKNTPYWKLLDVYVQYFDVTPLRELGLINPKFTELENDQKMWPSKVTLSIMIMAALRMQNVKLFNEGTDELGEILHLYKRYRALLVEGKGKTFSSLGETVHIQHAFLYTLGRYKQALPLLPILVQDMTIPMALREDESLREPFSQKLVPGEHCPREPLLDEDFPQDMPSEGKLPDPPEIVPAPILQPSLHAQHPVRHAPANAETFSILLDAYTRHGHMDAAERTLELMRSHNLRPEKLAWNSLIAGYSKVQDIKNVVHAMEQMEKEGWNLDEGTLRALARVKDQDKLLEAMEEREIGAGFGRKIGKEGAQPSVSYHTLTRE